MCIFYCPVVMCIFVPYYRWWGGSVQWWILQYRVAAAAQRRRSGGAAAPSSPLIQNHITQASLMTWNQKLISLYLLLFISIFISLYRSLSLPLSLPPPRGSAGFDPFCRSHIDPVNMSSFFFFVS